MILNEEYIHQCLINGIHEKLPAFLEIASEVPIKWLNRSDDGDMEWQELTIKLPLLEELWSQQQPMLNYPALLVHYQETTSSEVDECGDRDHTAFFFLDLILTHPNPEVLNFLWYRYAEAIKSSLRSIVFPFQLAFTGQRITEDSPLESESLRRGLIDVQITF